MSFFGKHTQYIFDLVNQSEPRSLINITLRVQRSPNEGDVINTARASSYSHVNNTELVKKSRQTDDKQSFPFIPLFASAGKQPTPPPPPPRLLINNTTVPAETNSLKRKL